MIESRVKYIGWIIKRISLSCHHLQGRRLPRSGTTQSLKEEKYSLAVAKCLAGGSWEIAKIGRVLQLLIQGNILGLSGFGRTVWILQFCCLWRIYSQWWVMKYCFGISRKAQSPERKNLHIAQFPETKGQLLFLPWWQNLGYAFGFTLLISKETSIWRCPRALHPNSWAS